MKQTKESGIWLPFASYNPLINGYCLLGRMDVHRGLFETGQYLLEVLIEVGVETLIWHSS